MEVDVFIDELTNCLVERSTGKVVDTEYHLVTNSYNKKDYCSWKFDWSIPQKNDFQVYELLVTGDDTVQGRIALRIDGGVANVDIVESAPHNFGSNGKYIGVGGHLFAIACKISIDNDCNGLVAFTSKTDLVEYYQKTLGAKVLFDRRMYLDENAAMVLLSKYMTKEVPNEKQDV